MLYVVRTLGLIATFFIFIFFVDCTNRINDNKFYVLMLLNVIIHVLAQLYTYIYL